MKAVSWRIAPARVEVVAQRRLARRRGSTSRSLSARCSSQPPSSPSAGHSCRCGLPCWRLLLALLRPSARPRRRPRSAQAQPRPRRVGDDVLGIVALTIVFLFILVSPLVSALGTSSTTCPRSSRTSATRRSAHGSTSTARFLSRVRRTSSRSRRDSGTRPVGSAASQSPPSA